ncbi:unnamed protein product [Phytophthora fragariaefolia]|uniref:Unnamed protein product n=1 Tax=Phytophthora fragariaefolia TaxID=1490495 RepID=A0A9W6TVF1_9STRA|nr:unnamed protein product [Phytophthora fragariaefolia]
MRSTVKYKTREVTTTKSLSYSRIYDDKKKFVIHTQTRPRPATTVQPLLPGDPASKYDGTMFLPPPIEPTHERARAGLQRYQQGSGSISPPPAPFSTSITKAPQSPSKYRAAPYLSMYDRLAQSNGIPVNRPIAPPVKPIVDPTVPSKPTVAILARPQNEDQEASSRLHKSGPKPNEPARGKQTDLLLFAV